ncbi:MAG TPA: glycosyltransferase family 39 protein [Pyrinomonadaceae bacterium]|jgi:4-amino-4-deoxy-L-arabinose transferase-like glycosyltransferase
MMPTKPTIQERLSSNLPSISLLVLTAAFALLWKLGAGSLAAWDEAIYAQVSKEIVRSGDWLTLRWEYQPWFEKPPLFMWTTALFYRLFGVSEFWARVPSALSGIGLIGVTYLIGNYTYGSKRVGLLAAVILSTCYHFLSFSRFGTMDVMLTLFTYLALYGYLRLNHENQKWWYLVWSSCALALMVKGAGGIIAPAAITLALAFDKRFSAAIGSRHFWQGVLLAFLLAAPWHILMYVWYGQAFINEYLGYHVIARSMKALEGHPSGYFYYIGKLVDGFFPWCLPVPFAVVSIIRRNLKAQARSWVLLLLCALVFGLYTVVPTRRPWYIVPLYPALAILVAAFISNLYQDYQSRRGYRRIVTAACAVLIIVGGLYSFVSLYLNHKPEESVAKLARLARSTSPDDRDSLVLLSGVEPFYAQVSLFYSDRPVQQTYVSSKPPIEDAERYVSYENLAEATQASAKRIILLKEDIQRLSADYDIHVLAEDDSLAYATIKHRR